MGWGWGGGGWGVDWPFYFMGLQKYGFSLVESGKSHFSIKNLTNSLFDINLGFRKFYFCSKAKKKTE